MNEKVTRFPSSPRAPDDRADDTHVPIAWTIIAVLVSSIVFGVVGFTIASSQMDAKRDETVRRVDSLTTQVNALSVQLIGLTARLDARR